MAFEKKPAPKISSAIIKAGFIAGTIDILSAFTFFYIRTGKNPILVLHYIASGLFGKVQAYQGGVIMAAAGLLMHYLIAFSWIILFFILYPKVKLMRSNTILVGLIFGIFVWVMMNLVIVPMTNIPPTPFNPSNAAINAIILIYAIGLPTSFIANRYYSRR